MSYERSKAPLALMEQIIMILVFALTAAVCMQAFVYSSNLSKQGENKNIADRIRKFNFLFIILIAIILEYHKNSVIVIQENQVILCRIKTRNKSTFHFYT